MKPTKFFTTLLILSGIVLLSSCLGPRKVNKWVQQHYATVNNMATKKSEDYISINTQLSSGDNSLSKTEKKIANILPLIVYWQYDYLNTCTLNPQLPINNFTETVLSYAHTKRLKQKLNGRKIEFTINKMPGAFSINDRGHIVWLIYIFSWDKIIFKAVTREMEVSYRVMEGDVEVKKGMVAVTGLKEEKFLGLFQSLRKRTKQFLAEYDAEVKVMSKKALDKIMSEL
ncbi:MAG TPA: hypothetical protein VFN30_15240 [Chitinophagaceae bacterium]|nr:hypothetical protein [Chitinophagaceae bacterium]